MELFATLSENFDISLDAEITMEANPGTLTMEKLEVYRQEWRKPLKHRPAVRR